MLCAPEENEAGENTQVPKLQSAICLPSTYSESYQASPSHCAVESSSATVVSAEMTIPSAGALIVMVCGSALGVAVAVGDAVAAGLLTSTPTQAVPIGVVPPFWKALTIRVCKPLATAVESQLKLPEAEVTAVPSTIN